LKILFIVTYLYSRGGDSNHAFAVAQELKKKEHEVSFFGMQDEQNFPELPGPFAPRVDYREILKSKNPFSLFKAFSSIYSFSAKKALISFINEHGPFDLAHIHNTHHQLTMATIDVLEKKEIPFVWTLHDYKLVCPNTSLFNDSTEKKCTEFGKGTPFCIIKNKCKKNSLPASILTALESWFNYIGGYYNRPEIFITPSLFLQKLLVDVKVTSRPIHTMPNFSIHKSDQVTILPGSDFLFIGRLVTGKGIDILIKAFAQILSSISSNLIIVGSGPNENNLKQLAAKLLPSSRYEFTGHISSSSEVANYYTKARCMVLPAVWFENMPLSILEAFAHARPVIGSNIGGIPEMVIDGKTGLLFEPGAISELAEKLLFYDSHAEDARIAGLNGWESVKGKFSRTTYIEEIQEVYRNAISGKYRTN